MSFSVASSVLLVLVAVVLPHLMVARVPAVQARVGSFLGLEADPSAPKIRREDFPEFILNAYNCLESSAFKSCLPVYHSEEVNLLRTFLGTANTSPSEAVRAYRSKSLKNSVQISFNVSLVNRGLQKVHYSMLRLYRHALSRVQIKVLKDKCGVDHSNDIVLQLYSQSGFSSKGIPQFQLRASKPLQLAKLGIGGWIEFRNLTTLFKSFVNISDNSTGSRLVDLRLAVQCLSVNPASLGLLFGSARERPQLVEFTENEMQKEMIFPKSMTLLASSQLQEQQQQQRRKRSVLTTAEEPTAVSSVPPDNSSEIAQTQGLPTLPSNYDSIKCTLYHHEIKFDASLGIHSPNKYTANICAGYCTHHPSNIQNLHAFLQSLAHTDQPGSVPKPCCVPKPSMLQPITLVTSHGDSELRMSKYADMIATECECL